MPTQALAPDAFACEQFDPSRHAVRFKQIERDLEAGLQYNGDAKSKVQWTTKIIRTKLVVSVATAAKESCCG